MLEIATSIFAFALFLFLGTLFWNLAEESDNKLLLSLFVTLTTVFFFCAIVSGAVCIGALLTIWG